MVLQGEVGSMFLVYLCPWLCFDSCLICSARIVSKQSLCICSQPQLQPYPLTHVPHAPGLPSRITEGKKKKKVLVTDSSLTIKCKSIALVLLNFHGLNFLLEWFLQRWSWCSKDLIICQGDHWTILQQKVRAVDNRVSDTVLTYIEFTYILVNPCRILGVLQTKNLKHREFN